MTTSAYASLLLCPVSIFVARSCKIRSDLAPWSALSSVPDRPQTTSSNVSLYFPPAKAVRDLTTDLTWPNYMYVLIAGAHFSPYHYETFGLFQLESAQGGPLFSLTVTNWISLHPDISS